MNKKIDINTWYRKDVYSFFMKDFMNPYVSITTQVCCTGLKSYARAKNESVFCILSYSIMKAINQIEELRVRITDEKEVVLYNEIDLLTPIAINDGKQFSEAYVKYCETFETYKQNLNKAIEIAKQAEDPYEQAKEKLQKQGYGIVTISFIPKIFFSSVTFTQKHLYADFPLMSVGKICSEQEREFFPFAIKVNHALVDGYHLQCLIENIENNIKELIS